MTQRQDDSYEEPVLQDGIGDDRIPLSDIKLELFDAVNLEPEDDPKAITDAEIESALFPPDTKGRLNFRMSNAMEEEIRQIAEDANYPLNSPSEVGRFCLMVGLLRLRKWKRRPTLIGSIRMANAFSRRDQIQAESLDHLDNLRKRVDWYLERNEIDAAIEYVRESISFFDGVQESFWKRTIVGEAEKELRSLMDRVLKEHQRTRKNL